MHVIQGKGNSRKLTDEEIQAFLATERNELVTLIPDEQFFDYVAIKTPQNYYRVMASYRNFSLFKYILDPMYGAQVMTDSWKEDIKFFSIRAMCIALRNGMKLTSTEIKYLYSSLKEAPIGSSLFLEIMAVVYYLPIEYRDKFVQIANMISYSTR